MAQGGVDFGVGQCGEAVDDRAGCGDDGEALLEVIAMALDVLGDQTVQERAIVGVDGPLAEEDLGDRATSCRASRRGRRRPARTGRSCRSARRPGRRGGCGRRGCSWKCSRVLHPPPARLTSAGERRCGASQRGDYRMLMRAEDTGQSTGNPGRARRRGRRRCPVRQRFPRLRAAQPRDHLFLRSTSFRPKSGAGRVSPGAS